MSGFTIKTFPKSRVATIDVCDAGKRKHHIAALLEIDVTESREKLKAYKQDKHAASFLAWLIKAISHTISEHPSAAAFLKGKRSAVAFEAVTISLLIEKEIDGQKVPLPLLIENADERSIEAIAAQIADAKRAGLQSDDIVLHRSTTRMERLYYLLPGFLRRLTWRIMLAYPGMLFRTMGNVAISSPGMGGRVNGWFIPIAIHPLCIGIGSVIRKPAVVDDRIEIRDIMNLTLLLDHDVIDGAPMARFVHALVKDIERGIFL